MKNSELVVISTSGHVHHMLELMESIRDEDSPSLIELTLCPSDKPLSENRYVIWGDEIVDSHFYELEVSRIKKRKKLVIGKANIVDRVIYSRFLSKILKFTTALYLFFIVFTAKKRNRKECFISAISRLPKIKNKFSKKFFGSRLEGLYDAFFNELSLGYINLKLYRDNLQLFIKENNVKTIYLPEFNVGYRHGIIASLAKENDIELIVSPYTLAGKDEWIKSFENLHSCQVKGILNFTLSKVFPNWVCCAQSSKLILPHEWLISSVMFGYEPNIPWVSNSGPEGTYIASDNFTKKYYLRQGVNVSDWDVILTSKLKLMHDSKEKGRLARVQLAKKYGLSEEKNWIVLALPPNQLDVVNTSKLEFSAYKDIVESFLKPLLLHKESVEILISVHPRHLPSEDCFESVREYIITEPVHQLIGLSDCFVASVSATIRWAVELDIPVVNYDVYKYNYSDYAGEICVKTITEYQSYMSSVDNELCRL